MESTPEASKNEATPNKSAGISKTLLTPCRRVGLCRRFKPNTSNATQHTPGKYAAAVFSSTLVENKELKISDSVHYTCTPVKPNNETIVHCDSNVCNTKSKNCNKQNENMSCKNIKFRPHSTNETGKSNKVKSKRTASMLQEVTTDSNTNFSDIKINCNKENLDNKTSVVNNLSSPTLNTLLQENVSHDQKFQVDKSKLTKRLSMRKDSSHAVDSISDTELDSLPSSNSLVLSDKFTSECSVNVKKLITFEEGTISYPIKKSKKRLQILYSSDEEDFVASRTSFRKSNVDGLNETLEEIQKRIKQKQDQLNSLKRASVYKKLHNIDELYKLTQIWKKGCQDALRHLLHKLREHVEMDMGTLIQNLNIPSHMITYSAEEDIFL